MRTGRPVCPEGNFRRFEGACWCVRVPVQGQKRTHRWISTGQTSLERARQAVRDSGIDRLVALHQAEVMTHDAISTIVHGRRVTCAEVLRGWQTWIELKVAPGTLDRYTRAIVGLAVRNGAMKKPLTVITEEMVDAYVNGSDFKLNAATVALTALQSFFRYAQAHAYTLGNPAQLVDVNRRQMSVTHLEAKHYEPVTEDEYARLLAAEEFTGFYRDAVVLGWCTGLRISDVCLLEWASFTEREIIIYVRKHYTGGKRMVLPMDDPLIIRPELREVIDRLLATPSAERHAVFVWPDFAATMQSPKHRWWLSSRFGMMMRALGIKKSFHSLRTAFSRRLRAAGRTIEQVAVAMAHEGTDITRIYTGESATNT